MGPKQYSMREKTRAAREHRQALEGHQKDIFKAGEADRKARHDVLKRIRAKHEWQNSSEEDRKMIEDKAIEELMAKRFAKGKSKEYHEHQLMVSQQKEREEEKKRRREEATEAENEARQKKKAQHPIAARREARFCQMIARLEAKVMAHGHDCLAAVGVSREGVEEEMRGFLGQLQGPSEDNNSPPAPEEVEEDDFEVVVSSDEDDEEDNEAEDDWIIDA
ncbi:conserved hypothetical protein [Coccidioides posadasii str. Silveira]|uniref:Uncharacterized protein n=1 Tax=Coccidioides posadasii (strain RMSCC 757 / Silveira) TaxID=443226 RepID=E9D868_COCPS|nr:conserved hypothetical protein [Coccidioides posadasii str. Silveira]